MIKYSKSSSSGIFDWGDYIQFTLPAGTYSIDGFNAKFKAAVLRQKQNWEPPQIKDLKPIIQENYAFTADNKFFIALGLPSNYL